jgi:hypothetical protein
MDNMIVEVPAELAETLISERVVRKPITWRGADIISVLTLTADLTSTMTAIIVSRAAITEFARSLVRGFARNAAPEAQLTISIRAGEKTEIVVETNDSNGVRRLTAHIEAVMNEEWPVAPKSVRS